MRPILRLLSLVLLWPVCAGGTTIFVDPQGTGDYPTIQAAVDAAQDGDVIELGDGTFTGDGNRDIEVYEKAITIRSQSGDPTACVIDCQGSAAEHHRAILFVSSLTGLETALEGITITGGYDFSGGAVALWTFAQPAISDCIFLRNTSPGMAGAIYTDYGNPVISRCAFIENSAGMGGGLCI